MLTQTLFDLAFIRRTQHLPSGGGFLPTSVSGLTHWFRAEDLSALGEDGSVGTGSAAWIDYQNNEYSGSQSTAANQPKYVTTKLANSKASIFFDGSDKLTLAPSINLSASTVVVLFKGNGTDSMILGHPVTNVQVRRFRSAENTISTYNGGFDTISTTFSSSISQSAVCVWKYGENETGGANNLAVVFYEGKYYRGWTSNMGSGAPDTVALIGDTSYGAWSTGSMAEICIWNRPLSTTEISDLYDSYWRVKYSNENLWVAP